MNSLLGDLLGALQLGSETDSQKCTQAAQGSCNGGGHPCDRTADPGRFRRPGASLRLLGSKPGTKHLHGHCSNTALRTFFHISTRGGNEVRVSALLEGAGSSPGCGWRLFIGHISTSWCWIGVPVVSHHDSPLRNAGNGVSLTGQGNSSKTDVRVQSEEDRRRQAASVRSFHPWRSESGGPGPSWVLCT